MSKKRDYSKYQKMHIETIKKTVAQWHQQVEAISKDELFRFFHSVKGTAASINLFAVSENADVILQMITSSSKEYWEKEEVESFLEKFIQVVYEYDEFIIVPDRMKLQKKSKEKFILIIDDDYGMLEFLKHSLEEQGYYVLATLHPDQAVHLWYNLDPDCVIIDVHLPKKNGFELIMELQEADRVFLTPVIMISVENTKETRVSAYRSGADDFIAKPFDLDEMIVRIERQIAKREVFEKNTLIDFLTGAFNRQFLEKELGHRIGEFRRTKKPFVVSLVDIDYFKKVNDQYGHLVGDDVLKSFVRFLQQNIREYDYIIRYGGEEFVLLFPDTTASQAKKMLERFLDGFSNEVFHTKQGEFCVTFSAGVVEINDGDRTATEWLELADHALYSAKHNGRRQVRLAEPQKVQKKAKSPFNIAIIDDDYIVRNILEEHCLEAFSTDSDHDFCIRAFENGEQFIEDDWHKNEHPFLVILDRMMPRMDGLEVLQYLRLNFPVHQYVVIMLTARNSEKDVTRALELGADDYITKPFSIVELEARIKRIIKRMN